MYLEIDVVWKEEEPGLRALASAEFEDLGHVLSAERRVGHNHVVLRYVSVLDHLDGTERTHTKNQACQTAPTKRRADHMA